MYIMHVFAQQHFTFVVRNDGGNDNDDDGHDDDGNDNLFI